MLSLRDLARLAERYAPLLDRPTKAFDLRGRTFGGRSTASSPHLMGVVNLSPDSWYRESVVLTPEAAIRRGQLLIDSGASILDIGSESSLDYAARVEPEAQIYKLIPVVEGLVARQLLVSVETYYPLVAQAALRAGAAIINFTGRDGLEELLPLIAKEDAGLILNFVEGAHVRDPRSVRLSDDAIGSLLPYFETRCRLVESAGVRRLWIDPGLGFYYPNLQDGAVRIERQMEMFLGTFRLHELGWPVCHALPHAFECFEQEVRCAEPFFAVLALLGQTDLLRTHEVSRVLGVVRAMRLFDSRQTSGPTLRQEVPG
ncbi:dihydropteroate synthase [Methylacidimicrobium tartarophylax]|uniref:Dihydropteroate synthase n=1 Tax=Methylacidimicrobium tartarophylax TaxID=1041768 RepID=A0A5E6M689_9BACT|nr:dihydropteroate synthase [Methylacidimicrobium tartarophylax]VVM04809.1 Dihydropteroate synthase [Methylacidimicrobium tartarophylax]